MLIYTEQYRNFLCAKYIAFISTGDKNPLPTAHVAYSPKARLL